MDSDRQLFEFLAAVKQVNYRPCPHDRGKHGGYDTNRERDGKTLDRTGAKNKQNQCRDQCRDIRIRDGNECFFSFSVNGLSSSIFAMKV